MMPAWIGPTGISKTPSPSATRCGNSAAGLDRHAPRPVERLAEREDAPRPPVVDHERAGIGVPDGDDPEEVPHLALVPVRGRDSRRQRGHLRARRDPRRRAASRTDRRRPPGGGGLEDVAHLQIAVRRRRLVGRHDRGQRHRVRSDEHGGRRREIARRDRGAP